MDVALWISQYTNLSVYLARHSRCILDLTVGRTESRHLNKPLQHLVLSD